MKKSLLALAFGTLGLGIAEFVMMSILPDVAATFSISIPTAGHLISAYALGVCVGAPLTTLIARTRPLKEIMMCLMAVFALGHLLTSLAPSYEVMLVTRFISGLPHGAFFGVGSIIADRVANKGKSTQAISIMVAGMTVANLVGVPFGTFLSHTVSWRAIFVITSVWGLITLFSIYKWVPYMEPLPNTGLKGQFRFLKNPAPWLIIIATMFGNGGVFAMYSYVTPLMTHIAGYPAQAMSLIMILAGAGMCMGNLMGGRLSDKFHPGSVAASTQLVNTFILTSIFLLASHSVMATTLLFFCTTCFFAIQAPEQLLLLKNARGGEMMGAAFIQIAFNLGNAIGAYLGGLPIAAGMSYNYPALVGASISFVGFMALAIYSHRYERSFLRFSRARAI